MKLVVKPMPVSRLGIRPVLVLTGEFLAVATWSNGANGMGPSLSIHGGARIFSANILFFFPGWKSTRNSHNIQLGMEWSSIFPSFGTPGPITVDPPCCNFRDLLITAHDPLPLLLRLYEGTQNRVGFGKSSFFDKLGERKLFVLKCQKGFRKIS